LYRRYNAERLTFDSLAYNGGWWTWKNDPNYWDTVNLPSNTFGKPIPHLRSVCWLDGSISLSGIVSGFRYRLYLLHGFD
jgi:hypothetical protein